LKSRFRSLVKEIRERDQQLESAAGELTEIQVNVQELQQKLADSEANCESLIGKLQANKQKVEIGKAVARANHFLADKLSKIESAVELHTGPTFRSIVLASLMAKRWRKLVGTERTYSDFNRSWWWLTCREKAEVVPKIVEYQKTIETLQADLETAQQTLKAAAAVQQSTEKRIDEQENQLAAYESQIDDLTAKCKEMDNMVCLELFKDLKARYDNTKGILKSAKSTLKEKEEELAALNQKVQNLEQETKLQHSRLVLSAKTSKDLQDKLLKARDEVNMLRLELQRKHREMLSLERGVKKEKAEKKILTSQMQCVIGEEQARGSPPDVERVSHLDLGIRLANMSKALAQT